MVIERSTSLIRKTHPPSKNHFSYTIQPRGILARELAERCETTERTIYRDLENLSGSFIPVTNLGHSKGYEYTGNFSMYPIA
ncbi:HTH domain-containing protein [Ammoniphilus sp. YIM 78166]|uniref:HTH domain-containing protein n=1 Tax=Ammoniphilus sp. YIM 78166 TaxID=1644106 RepID=UPI00351792B5